MSNPTELPDLERQFRKKPVVIEAIQWTGKLACLDAFNIPELHQSLGSDKIGIATLEGTMIASVGDWIIKGVKGEFYPCKPDIFEATYEPAARRAQPEGEAPQAEPCYGVYRQHHEENDGKEFFFCSMWHNETNWGEGHRVVKGLFVPDSAATLSPLCGAQHAESGKEAAVPGWEQRINAVSPSLRVKTKEQAMEAEIAAWRVLAAQQAAAPDGNWLWSKLMEWCKKRGVAPANYDDLFAIVGEARAAQLDGGQEGSESNG